MTLGVQHAHSDFSDHQTSHGLAELFCSNHSPTIKRPPTNSRTDAPLFGPHSGQATPWIHGVSLIMIITTMTQFERFGQALGPV